MTTIICFKSKFLTTRDILSICVCLLFINTTFGQTTNRDIIRLVQECPKGNVKSCEELVDIVKNDENFWMRKEAENFQKETLAFYEEGDWGTYVSLRLFMGDPSQIWLPSQ